MVDAGALPGAWGRRSKGFLGSGYTISGHRSRSMHEYANAMDVDIDRGKYWGSLAT